MDIISNSKFSYVLIGVLYAMFIIFIIIVLVRRKNKRDQIVREKKSSNDNFEHIDLESVLNQMREETDKEKDTIMSFEQEQEEKAIISYKELLKAVNKEVAEVVKPADELTSVIDSISNKNVEKETSEILEIEEPLDVFDKKEDKPKMSSSKFQNSEFISPIYGRVSNDVQYQKIPLFEQQDKVEENLGKTIAIPTANNTNNEEFLKALREFRNNLE